MTTSATPDSMRAYYARRAPEYEAVYHKPERQETLRRMEAWLPDWFVDRTVLELACGTGWWTPHGARRARHWLATDLNTETLAVAQAKSLPPCVDFAIADAYALAEVAGRSFDAAFTACWWSHLPLARLDGWLQTLHAALPPGAVVVHLDNAFVQTSNLPITRRDAEGNSYQTRPLADGTTHEVLKNFPAAEDAMARLGPRAREVRWHDFRYYWALTYVLA